MSSRPRQGQGKRGAQGQPWAPVVSGGFSFSGRSRRSRQEYSMPPAAGPEDETPEYEDIDRTEDWGDWQEEQESDGFQEDYPEELGE